jgi:predicted phosphohydrolase
MMRIFAIGDLHLAGGTDKTMDRFGDHWRNHDRKIFDAWQRLAQDEDLSLIVGDTSWAMRLPEAMPDLERISSMPGRKLMLKGNHDYWWETLSKMRRVVDPSIDFLQGSAVIMNRVAIAGTRGWTCPDGAFFEEEDRKIYDREVGRLRAALFSLSGREADYDRLIVALHYPPTNESHAPSGFTELIDEFKADVCVYGHLHGDGIRTGLVGVRGRTHYHLVSADAVDFTPFEIRLT